MITDPSHMKIGALRAVMNHIRDSMTGRIPASRAFCWHGAETRKNLIPLSTNSFIPTEPKKSTSAQASSSKKKTTKTTAAQCPDTAPQRSTAGPPKPRKRSPKPSAGKDADAENDANSVLSESDDGGLAFNLPASRAGTETPILGSEDDQEMPDNAPDPDIIHKTSFRTVALVHPAFLKKNQTVEKLNPTWNCSAVQLSLIFEQSSN